MIAMESWWWLHQLPLWMVSSTFVQCHLYKCLYAFQKQSMVLMDNQDWIIWTKNFVTMTRLWCSQCFQFFTHLGSICGRQPCTLSIKQSLYILCFVFEMLNNHKHTMDATLLCVHDFVVGLPLLSSIFLLHQIISVSVVCIIGNNLETIMWLIWHVKMMVLVA